jgi:ribonuclease BN (tRNA processing enzyme)
VRLTVLGCSGSFPGPGEPCSSYLVEHDGYRILLDLGNGALGELQRHVGLLDVDAVLLSHLHGDHCLDLCAYAVVRRYHPQGRPPRLPVYGPPGTAGRLAAAYDPFSRDDLRDVFAFTRLESGTREIGPFTITFARMAHPVETYAMRVEAGGRTLTYSGDTAPCDALVAVARGSDMLLCDASYHHGDDVPPGLHLTGVQAGEHARRADVGRLLLTHVLPWTDPARQLADAGAAFGGSTELVARAASYQL